MKLNNLKCIALLLGIVFFSYSLSNAQVVDGVKKVVDKTADVSKDVADETKDGTKKVVKKTADISKDVGEKTVDASKSTYKKAEVVVTEGVVPAAKATVNAAEYITVSAWDGTKWVSKKVKRGTLKGVKRTETSVEILGDEIDEEL